MNETHKSYITTPDSSSAPTAEDLECIRRFTRKEVTQEEIYTFPLTLCDNDIDRDLERFGTESLDTLAEMFVGKSGIFDHNMSAHDQTARIYRTECCSDPSRTTQTGETYRYIRALAYMPRLSKNAELISEIDSGIKKEVSIGCAVAVKRCSVCGKDVLREGCTHQKGQLYDGKLCHHILEMPTDAYEWSFVAVPAQRNAGVTKSYTTKERNTNMQDILKSIRECRSDLTLTPAQQKLLAQTLDALEADAALGKMYRDDLAADTYRAGLAALPGLDGDVLQSVCQKASVPELKALCKSFGTVSECLLPHAAQTFAAEDTETVNHAFQI